MKINKSELTFLKQLTSEVIILDKDLFIIWLNDSALNKGWFINNDKDKNLLSDQLSEETNGSLIGLLKKTIETKEAHYWSRSRNALWQKGKTSGFVQKVLDFRIDDDQDSLWMSVDIGDGASCHVGYKSCFYRSIPLGPIKNTETIELEFKETKKKFDPKKVYKGQPNPTKL